MNNKFKGRIVRNTVKSNKITNGENLRLLVISDLHNYYNNPVRRNRLIEAIKEERPNIILIAGDIYNHGKYLRNSRSFRKFIKELSSVSKVCLTLGNHDLYGINNKNIGKYIDSFYRLREIENVYPLYNDTVVIDGVEVLSYVPNNRLNDLRKQVSGLAHQEFINDYNKEGIKFEESSLLKLFLGHNPHLIVGNGCGLGELSKCDYFITGHLHDGYKCYVGFNKESFKYDNGWVEQPLYIYDVNGNKVWHLWPPILGKTNLCRGIIYFDDMAREKVWQSPDNKYYQNVSLDLMKYDWQEIEESVANAIILGDNLHGMLISEGISPGFLANERWATINIIDFIAC